MTTFSIGLIFFIFCLCSLGLSSKKSRKWASCIVCVIMIMQSGFRDYKHMTNDTLNYENSYENIKQTSLHELVGSFKLIASEYTERDPGYNIFVKLSQYICDDFRFFLVLVAFIISIPLCYLLYQFIPSASGIYFAALIYESLFANFFMTGIRQTIAMGIVYASIPSVCKNKILKHYIILLIAYTIHSSVLIFTPIALLRQYSNQRKFLFATILMIPFFMAFASNIVAYIGQGTIFESYTIGGKDNIGTPIFSSMLLIIALITALYSKEFINHYPKSYQLLFATLAMSCCLMPATWVNSNFIRIVFFHLIFILPTIPMLIECLASNTSAIISRTSMYIFVGIGLLFLMY